jgi:hypothetical protein
LDLTVSGFSELVAVVDAGRRLVLKEQREKEKGKKRDEANFPLLELARLC